MCLRFVFLLIMRLAAWLRLSRRAETWKTAEILILRHQLTVLQRRQPRRPKLNWADRALLATLLSVIPKARRHGLPLLVTPDTILRWHHDIVRRRQAASSTHGNTGRPATRRNIRALVLRLARQNPEWGYRRIHGELSGPGVKIAAPAVWEILKTSGTGPAPRRTAPTWSQFLRSQAEAILASDFFTQAPVRAENRIHGSDQQSCSPGTSPVMITVHVPAVRVHFGHSASRVAAAVPVRGGVEDRRNLDPAPPARRPAAAAAGPRSPTPPTRSGCRPWPPEPERPGQDPRHRPGPRTRAPALAPCPVTSDGAIR
jgi:hypothetical protein